MEMRKQESMAVCKMACLKTIYLACKARPQHLYHMPTPLMLACHLNAPSSLVEVGMIGL